jgi:hypothetical protein
MATLQSVRMQIVAVLQADLDIIAQTLSEPNPSLRLIDVIDNISSESREDRT